MKKLSNKPHSFRTLDAAQLIKHAFGLANQFKNETICLNYLYWEPTNADQIELCRTHRREITDFARRIEGSRPDFNAMSYDQLWRLWEQMDEPTWLKPHVKMLRKRYDVAMQVQ